MNEDLLLADGFGDAFLGVGKRCSKPDVAVYDVSRCVDILMRDGMDYEEAVQYLEFNTIGAWMGERTPIWLVPIASED
jgi:hypothetical protein